MVISISITFITQNSNNVFLGPWQKPKLLFCEHPPEAAEDLCHPQKPIQRPGFGGLMATTARIDDHHLIPEG